MKPRITVVGSINLDLVARCERLPRPGETVTGATFARVPGGKGRQPGGCLRAAWRGRDLHRRRRGDSFAEEALAGLRDAGVRRATRHVEEPTGVALILVDGAGENQIVVAPGANWRVLRGRRETKTPGHQLQL